MRMPHGVTLIVVGVVMAIASPVIAGGGHHHAGESAEHHEEHREPRGPHGGRVLRDGAFAVELSIFEQGVPPRYRLYGYDNDRPIAPAELAVKIRLFRFGGVEEVISFLPSGDFLQSEQVIGEPHSFRIEITATRNGTTHTFAYESFEGRTELSESALKVARLEFDQASPAKIGHTARVYGRIIANEDRVAHIGARFPGIIREIRKSLGDRVEKGEVLALVESNQSLQLYEVRSLTRGVILQRHATLGEVISDSDPLYVVADLSRVWADFQVYRDDIGALEVGQKVRIELGGSAEPVEGTVSYLSPTVDEVTQSRLIRAELENAKGELRPGLFVSGILTLARTPVAVAVKREAIQTFRDWSVVYRTDGRVFQATPVVLGRRDAVNVEILSGLSAGDRYVTTNSFVIKADIEKSGASHDH
jgi:membrane fusion protein, heavy metal efflux system